MAPAVTEIVNNTQQVLNMRVGNHHYFVDFAKIRKGAKHRMQVNYNDTYQEFSLMGPDPAGKNNVVVTSDDCCDYKCITITETVDGHFTVDRVPRMHYRSMESEEEPAPEEETEPAPVAKKHRAWKSMFGLM